MQLIGSLWNNLCSIYIHCAGSQVNTRKKWVLKSSDAWEKFISNNSGWWAAAAEAANVGKESAQENKLIFPVYIITDKSMTTAAAALHAAV